MPLGPVAPEAPPMVDLADVSTIAPVSNMLAGLGVLDALLQQVKCCIPPPSVNRPRTVGPEKQLQILAGKINVLEQQLAKLGKTRDKLAAELDVCHVQTADKNSQLESLRAQYREVRDNGKFTPTRASPAASVVAVSVDGDDDPSRGAAFDVGASGRSRRS